MRVGAFKGMTSASSRPAFVRVAIVRLLLTFAALAAAYLGAQAAVFYAVKAAPADLHDTVRIASQIGVCILMLLIYVFVVWLLEGRGAKELALGPGVPNAIGGVVVGVAGFCAVYVILLAMGVAHWQGVAGYGPLLPAAMLALIAGVGEELAVRGGLFRVLEDSVGTLVALVISAAVFGLLHASNKGATPVSTAAIAIEAGVLLAAAYAMTRNLWFPIGLHFGWNWTEGGVFGEAVSGGAMKGAVKISMTGPDLLTGGAFGPEASVVAIAVSVIISLVMIVITIRSGRWKPLGFRMMLD
jgi:membrane protease YdiL (CAAX protease family)